MMTATNVQTALMVAFSSNLLLQDKKQRFPASEKRCPCTYLPIESLAVC
jgi:hypothetical protein